MKERLGDKYAAMTAGEWQVLIGVQWRRFGARANREGSTPKHIVAIAATLFRGSAFSSYVELSSWSVHCFVLAASAFQNGAIKYGCDTWHTVSIDDHLQAAGRHFDAWLREPGGLDQDSRLPHECHFLARAMMVSALRQRKSGSISGWCCGMLPGGSG